MSGIEDQVLVHFFERLSEAEEVNDSAVAGLRQALAEGHLPKVEPLLTLFFDSSGEKLT